MNYYDVECNSELVKNIEILYETFGYGIFCKSPMYIWKPDSDMNFLYFNEQNNSDIAFKLFVDEKYKWLCLYDWMGAKIYLKNKEDAVIFKLIKE
jgi:hypothetical protein